MDESDVLQHLAKQTSWPLSDVELLDVWDADSQLLAGQRLLEGTAPFVVGSSGVEYAVAKALGLSRQSFPPLSSVDRLIAVSGSVSPTTERQIRFALQNGFAGLAVDPLTLLGENRAQVLQSLVEHAVAQINAGQSVLVHTALGPPSDVGQKLATFDDGRRLIGEALGQVLAQVLKQTNVRRAIVAGGDSSSHALGQLDVVALTTRFPLAATPGSPLCVAHSGNATIHGLEIALKGGQVGGDDYFIALRDGLAGEMK
jgi:3-oxoisoapionate kinase